MTADPSSRSWRLVLFGMVVGGGFFLLDPWISPFLVRVTAPALTPLLRATTPRPTPTPEPPPPQRPAGAPPPGGWSRGQARQSSLDGFRLGDVDPAGVLYAADGFDVLALGMGGEERWRTTLARRSHVDVPRLVGSSLIVPGPDRLSLLSVAGKLQFEVALEPESGGRRPLAFAGERFVVGRSRHVVSAFAVDGRELWSRDFASHSVAGVAIDEAGRAYVAVEGRLFAIDAFGRELWKYGGKELQSYGPSAYMLTVGPDGLLYGTSAWSIVALQPDDGRVVWQDVGYGTACATDGISWRGANVYAACQSTVSSYAADGQRRWRVTLENPGRLQPPIADGSGTVYVAAKATVPGSQKDFGLLTAISDSNGSVLFSSVLERPLTTRPLVGRDGVVYLGGDNRVYAVAKQGRLLWERRLHPRESWSNPVARLEPTPVGIAGSADRTFVIPLTPSPEAPRSFTWRRAWE